MNPKHPSHIRFLNKMRRFCGKHGIFIYFSRAKSINSGEGERLYGYFEAPYKGSLGSIRVAAGEGWGKALYTLAHEVEHVKQYIRDKKNWSRQVLSGSLRHYKRLEIGAEKGALALLKKEKVKVDMRKVKASVKRYVDSIESLG